MEAQDEDFEARIRALEGWRAEKVGEERRLSTVSAGAGGVVGGVVAVIVRVLGGGEIACPAAVPPAGVEPHPESLLAAGGCPVYTFAPVCTSFAPIFAPELTSYCA